jgi:hypothetical protein
VREAGLVVEIAGEDPLDAYEQAIRATQAHKSVWGAALELVESNVPVQPKALDLCVRSTRSLMIALTPGCRTALERSEVLAERTARRLLRTREGRAWRRNAHAHRKALQRQSEPFEADESYVRGGLTNLFHVFLRGQPCSPDGLAEALMVVGWQSSDGQEVATPDELSAPLRALHHANLRRLLRQVSHEELSAARARAQLLREWLAAYVDCARIVYGTPDAVPAYAAALPVIERMSLAMIALVILATEQVFGRGKIAAMTDRLESELREMEAGRRLVGALPAEYHPYLREGALEALDEEERLRASQAIAAAGLSLPQHVQDILIESAKAA